MKLHNGYPSLGKSSHRLYAGLPMQWWLWEIEPQENIGIFSQNKPECLFTDFGAFANRAVTIPLYATSSPAQAQYIINDAQIRYLFVGEQFQYDAAFSVFGFCQSLQQLIIFDRAVVKDPRDMTSHLF